MSFYVYAYYEKDSAVPFYIGKGCRDRDTYHAKEVDSTAVSRKIQSLGGWKEIDIQRLSEDLEEGEAFILERRLIQLHGRIPTGPLLNLTDGGEGSSGYRKLPKQCRRHSEFMKGNRYGAANRGSTRQPDPKRIKIACYGPLLIKVYDAMLLAEKDGYIRSAIRRCLEGKQALHAGLRWEYVNE